MNRRSCIAILSLAAPLTWLAAGTLWAAPPARQRILPGAVKGRLEIGWLAPYVQVRKEHVGSASVTSVRWLTEEGQLVRELAGPNIDANAGFVSDPAHSAVHAVHGQWKIVLPRKEGPAGYITATTDSRTFLHQYYPNHGQVAVDIYVLGQLANTVGPFRQYRGEGVQLSVDGSTAMLSWRSAAQQHLQVIVAGPDGRTRFQSDCIAGVPIAAPGGHGVLVAANTPDARQVDFTYYTKKGEIAAFRVGPNATFVDWVPGTTAALISTSVGETEHFQLVQCTTGQTIWRIPDPNPRAGIGCAAMAVKEYVLFHGYDFAAVDVETGQMVARWKPGQRRPVGANGAWFRKLGTKLFLVSDHAFADVNLDDIGARKDGWR